MREFQEAVMLSRITLACAGALTILPHLAAAAGADSLPTASVESICRDAQSAALPESKAAAYRSCMQDEGAARDELRQKWAHYSAAARSNCAEPSQGVAISYVELQTCLDMQSGGLSKPIPDVAPSRRMMAPPPPPAPK
jgi:hypothetical protein